MGEKARKLALEKYDIKKVVKTHMNLYSGIIQLLIYKIMLIAITGASGFVGKYLSRHLLDSGHAVSLIQRKKGANVFYIDDIFLSIMVKSPRRG